MSVFDSFEKKHEFLVCVDSDGCVMDTMNCKHIHCFGPCMVQEWDLQAWNEAVAVAFGKLQSGEYAAYGAEKKQEFLRNLGG